MRAVVWNGTRHVQVENVPDPVLLTPRDAIVRVTLTAICGSDLHLYDGVIPTMEKGDILGHEFMGEVVEVGKDVSNLHKGDRVIVPFAIACGNCYFCKLGLTSLCDNSNPNAGMAEAMYGSSAAGLFGYSHLFGGYAGGQAEYVRVPYADFGPLKIPQGIPDDKVLFLTDIFPTGYQAASNANIHKGDTVAVWGCGPVGLFTIKSAYMLGAARVIAIDSVPERLRMAETFGGAITIDRTKTSVGETLRAMTGGRGPDSCIDAVGLEAHGATVDAVYDQIKQNVLHTESDRPHVLREAIHNVRSGGTVSVPGVYGGLIDKFNFGDIFNKGLTVHAGQTHVQTLVKPLLDKIMNGEIDLSAVITHRVNLDDAPDMYRTFQDKQDGCIKVVMTP